MPKNNTPSHRQYSEEFLKKGKSPSSLEDEQEHAALKEDPDLPSLLDLPLEIIFKIFSFLSPEELVKVSRTCKFLMSSLFDRDVTPSALWLRYHSPNGNQTQYLTKEHESLYTQILQVVTPATAHNSWSHFQRNWALFFILLKNSPVRQVVFRALFPAFTESAEVSSLYDILAASELQLVQAESKASSSSQPAALTKNEASSSNQPPVVLSHLRYALLLNSWHSDTPPDQQKPGPFSLDKLLNSGLVPDKSCLLAAIANGHLPTFKKAYLLADQREKDNALYYMELAVKEGCLPILEYLVERIKVGKNKGKGVLVNVLYDYNVKDIPYIHIIKTLIQNSWYSVLEHGQLSIVNYYFELAKKENILPWLLERLERQNEEQQTGQSSPFNYRKSMYYVVKSGNLKLLDFFLENIRRNDEEINNLLWLDLILFICRKSASDNLFVLCAENGHLELFEKLFSELPELVKFFVLNNFQNSDETNIQNCVRAVCEQILSFNNYRIARLVAAKKDLKFLQWLVEKLQEIDPKHVLSMLASTVDKTVIIPISHEGLLNYKIDYEKNNLRILDDLPFVPFESKLPPKPLSLYQITKLPSEYRVETPRNKDKRWQLIESKKILYLSKKLKNELVELPEILAVSLRKATPEIQRTWGESYTNFFHRRLSDGQYSLFTECAILGFLAGLEYLASLLSPEKFAEMIERAEILRVALEFKHHHILRWVLAQLDEVKLVAAHTNGEPDRQGSSSSSQDVLANRLLTQVQIISWLTDNDYELLIQAALDPHAYHFLIDAMGEQCYQNEVLAKKDFLRIILKTITHPQIKNEILEDALKIISSQKLERNDDKGKEDGSKEVEKNTINRSALFEITTEDQYLALTVARADAITFQKLLDVTPRNLIKSREFLFNMLKPLRSARRGRFYALVPFLNIQEFEQVTKLAETNLAPDDFKGLIADLLKAFNQLKTYNCFEEHLLLLNWIYQNMGHDAFDLNLKKAHYSFIVHCAFNDQFNCVKWFEEIYPKEKFKEILAQKAYLFLSAFCINGTIKNLAWFNELVPFHELEKQEDAEYLRSLWRAINHGQVAVLSFYKTHLSSAVVLKILPQLVWACFLCVKHRVQLMEWLGQNFSSPQIYNACKMIDSPAEAWESLRLGWPSYTNLNSTLNHYLLEEQVKELTQEDLLNYLLQAGCIYPKENGKECKQVNTDKRSACFIM